MNIRVAIIFLALLPVVVGCVNRAKIEGVNLLQSEAVALEAEGTRESLANLRRLGANTVALVSFLRQLPDDTNTLEPAGEISQEGLRKAIRWARELGLRVLLKPQVLVDEGWTGDLSPDNWRLWFESYGDHLEALARLAQEEGVEVLIIGTELRQSACQPYWPVLIRRLRAVYSGRLSYAAHGIEGMRAFAFWGQLDLAAITLYPVLGENAAEAEQSIAETMKRLKRHAAKLPIPLLVAEVGIASRSQVTRRPWAWRDLSQEESAVDLMLQRQLLELWLQALSADWLQGVLVWSWSSNPDAGGADDIGFTPQNKPAEKVLACHWRGVCR